MTIDTLGDLFLHSLTDMLTAERTTLTALPATKRRATDARLKAALSLHLAQTEQHVRRLQAVFDLIGTPANAMTWTAALPGQGPELDDTQTVDADLIGLAEAVETYETARCGTLVTWAQHLGHPNLAAVLEPLPLGRVEPRTWAERRAPHRSHAA